MRGYHGVNSKEKKKKGKGGGGGGGGGGGRIGPRRVRPTGARQLVWGVPRGGWGNCDPTGPARREN